MPTTRTGTPSFPSTPTSFSNSSRRGRSRFHMCENFGSGDADSNGLSPSCPSSSVSAEDDDFDKDCGNYGCPQESERTIGGDESETQPLFVSRPSTARTPTRGRAGYSGQEVLSRKRQLLDETNFPAYFP
ncbi:unnamed protein product, partial [Amoebophrya sp. A120]|eukprot:GSA120T00009521001.1